MSLPDHLLEDDRPEEPECIDDIYSCKCSRCTEWRLDLYYDSEFERERERRSDVGTVGGV